MANFFRCRVGIIQRSRGGSAVARAAYQSCRKLVAPDGREYDFTSNRESHGHTRTIICAPPASPSWVFDPQQLWTRAVLAEKRCNSQEARTAEIALPREIPSHLQEACVRDLVCPFTEVGMVVQADIHSVTARDGGSNDHVHLEMTLRRLENGEFSCYKARDWNGLFWGQAQNVRTQVATRLNEFCRRHNINYYADPRSNEARGLPEPELTLPRWNILLAQRTGTPTAWLLENEEHRLARARIVQLEKELRQTERAIQIERELIAKGERKRAAEREAFVRRRVHLEKVERREAFLQCRRVENFEVLPSAPPESSMENIEPSYPRPP